MPPAVDDTPARATTRVVDVQRQAATTLRLSLAFVVAAPVAVLGGWGSGAWLPMHLFLVLAVTWSAHALTTIRRTSGNARFHPAIDGYLLAIGWALLGAGLGITMAVADPGSWWMQVRAAHLAANLLGLVGLVIASTLPYFVATQARMKMSPAASAPAMRTTFIGLSAAVAVIAVGHAFQVSVLEAAGYLAYAVGLVHLLRLLPAVGRRQLDWAGPRLLQLGAGMAWWIDGVTWLAIGALDSSFDASRTTRGLRSSACERSDSRFHPQSPPADEQERRLPASKLAEWVGGSRVGTGLP